MAYAFNDDKSKANIKYKWVTLGNDSTGAIPANSIKALYFYFPSGYSRYDVEHSMLGMQRIELRDDSTYMFPVNVAIGNWHIGETQYEGELRAYIRLNVYNPDNSATSALNTNSKIVVSMLD